MELNANMPTTTKNVTVDNITGALEDGLHLITGLYPTNDSPSETCMLGGVSAINFDKLRLNRK